MGERNLNGLERLKISSVLLALNFMPEHESSRVLLLKRFLLFSFGIMFLALLKPLKLYC